MSGETPTIDLDVNEIVADVPEKEVDEPATEPAPSADETKKEAGEVETTEGENPKESESETEGEETEDENESESEETTDETKEEDQPKGKMSAEERKQALSSEIRTLANQKTELRAEIASLNAQVYRAKTSEELQEEGLDPAMAEIEAMKQTQKMSDYNNYVTDLNANLNVESLQVLHDFPVYDPESSDYNAELATRAEAVYRKVANIQIDPKTKLVVQASVLPYDIYKAFAETHKSGATNGQVKGQKATEKMLAAAETPSSSAPKQPKEDPFLTGLTKGFEG